MLTHSTNGLFITSLLSPSSRLPPAKGLRRKGLSDFSLALLWVIGCTFAAAALIYLTAAIGLPPQFDYMG